MVGTRLGSIVSIAPDVDSGIDFIAPGSLQLIPTPGLPIQFTISDGTPLTLREVRPDDIQKFYAALLSVIQSGGGYGVDELPDLAYFVKCYVNGWRNMVFELSETAEPVAYANTDGPSVFSRSATDAAIADGGNMIVVEKFRGKGWYFEMMSMGMIRLMRNNKSSTIHQKICVGYQGDMALTNIINYATARKFGYRVNGTLPRGIYLQGHGWIDVLLFYMTHDEMIAAKSGIKPSHRSVPVTQVFEESSTNSKL